MPDSLPSPRGSSFQFIKMEGLGNDFVVVLDRNLRPLDGVDLNLLARQVCDRHRGIGADGLVLVKTHSDGAHLRIFNSDGSAARNCGNALLCVAKLLWSSLDSPLRKASELQLEIEGGGVSVATARRVDEDIQPVVRIDPPDFTPSAIPMELTEGMKEPVLQQELHLGAEQLKISALSLGNPHCVLFVNDLNEHQLGRLGPRLENASCFPERANVELVRVLNRHTLEVLVWERGVGPTLACGTGACAAAIVSRMLEKTEGTVTVQLPGGSCEVTWFGEGLPVFLAGFARKVFEGRFWLPSS